MRKSTPGFRSTLTGVVSGAAVLLLAACVGTTSTTSSSGPSTPPSNDATARPNATQLAPAPSSGGSAPPSSPVAGSQVAQKLNLNTASAEQFKTIPNVGDRFVREFNEYRPYTSIIQFRREIGKYVNQEQVSEWEKYVYVPIDPNSADPATLRQIPGVDDNISQQLIVARPFPSNERFLARLGQNLTPAQVAVAATMLK